jgi:hypothetical protein
MNEDKAKKLKEAEDYVSLFLNGGHCSESNHNPAKRLHKLIAWKMLVLEFPHLSRNIGEIDTEIRRELKQN